jgi:hypothetical protein
MYPDRIPGSRRLAAAALSASLIVVIGGCAAAGSTATLDPNTGCSTSPVPAPESIGAWSAPQTPSIYPQVINPAGTLACGQNRFMFSFLDDQNIPVAAPDRPVSVAFYDLGADAESPVTTVDGTFVWAIEDVAGIYVANVDFPSSGQWGAEFRTTGADGADEAIRVQFDVQESSSVVSVGDQAPASDTPTLDDVGGDISLISTDDEPVEAFYETSVSEALAAGEPFVLVFATPKFCVSAQCGPTLDRLKPIAAAHPELTFINVEPYQLEAVEGQLQPILTGEPPQLTPATATNEWRLAAEPWVFVVDGDGIVTASFMLIFSDEELEAAIAAVE